MILKNKIYVMTITDMNNLGYGIGKIEGIVVFVNAAVTGDSLQIKIIKVNRSYCIGKIETILVSSPYRLSPKVCPIQHQCGGCTYPHITYSYELELKKNYIESALKKAGLPHILVENVLSTGTTTHYRNKAQYPVSQDPKTGKIKIGFYANNSHTVIAAENCVLQPPIFSQIVDCIKRFMQKYSISAYQEEMHQGLLRHIYLRYGKNTDTIMVCLVLNGTDLPRKDCLVSTLCTEFPSITSIMLNFNREKTNVITGNSSVCIYGKEYLEDVLCGLTFHISPLSFYQVNHDAAELLYQTAKNLADIQKEDTIIDFFCGIGTISLFLAQSAKKVYGIEIIPEAVENAKQNARLNHIENAEFFCGDVIEISRTIAANIAVIDPPRKGCTPEFIQYLAELAPEKIIYISCNPDTLARDLALFEKNDYFCGTIIPVDLFSRTGHVECVCLLTRTSK